MNDIVAYLNENKDAKVQVTGYADAGTGNDKINDRLAAQRADAVVKALKDAGIAADRITFDSKGARVQTATVYQLLSLSNHPIIDKTIQAQPPNRAGLF